MLKSTDVIGIMGRRGCGKSFLGGKLRNVFPRRVIFDTTHEHTGPLMVYDFKQFSQVMLYTENASQFEIIVRFDIEHSKKSEEFDEMLKILYYRGSVCIVLEEIQNFSSPHSISPFLEHIFTTGRHRDLAVIYTTQRPGQLHKTALSQSSHIFCGQLHDRNDLNQVGNFMGADSKKLAHLPEYHFLWWTPGKTVLLDPNLRAISSDNTRKKFFL